ncbi:glyceraldehyde-3-phosphate dehydrogenase [Spirochaetia bacterium]|nr:glyceraldehyde-3-phosphate dehydrogenase [Spirochaetia bacterium]
MAVNIAINGFGRIGRLVFSRLLGDRAFEIVAINDSASGMDCGAKPELLAWLLKYETPREGRPIGDTVQSGPDFISLKGKNIKTHSETDPSKLPWKKLKVDLVLDCTGLFASKEQAAAHLAAGAKKVFLIPPSAAYPLIVYGINEKNITPTDRIISAPSPALSSLAPLVRALNDFVPIRSGILTAESGSAAIAADISSLLPELQDKLIGSPAVTGGGSTALLTAVVKGKNITAAAINKALNTKIEGARTLVLSAGEDLYQVQILTRYGSEDAYAAVLVKTLKYLVEPKSDGPAKPETKKPSGGAKSANPVLPRKPLINFPK